MQIHLNDSPRHGQALDPSDRFAFGPEVMAEVRENMRPLQYPTTPLRELPALAAGLGLSALLMKDESGRSELASFKALGGAYAVIRLVLAESERILRRPVSVDELGSDTVRAVASQMTVACATDGNHGRSVAAGARLTGARCVIYIHAGVSQARAEAMSSLGAHVLRVNGSYDDSLAEADQAAARENWFVVADTVSTADKEAIPLQVMQGYLLMVDEALTQCASLDRSPTHVFLQAGVGGFAAATAAHVSLRLGDRRPKFVIVEPDRAACLYASALAKRPVRVAAGEPTFMAMLECYEPSRIAWRILDRFADAFVTVDEEAGLRAMYQLAKPLGSDPFILSGESGGAGLAGVMEAMNESATARALGLDNSSIVLAFNTEGATDRARYESLLARVPYSGVRGTTV